MNLKYLIFPCLALSIASVQANNSTTAGTDLGAQMAAKIKAERDANKAAADKAMSKEGGTAEREHSAADTLARKIVEKHGKKKAG